ncbi:dioxygenase family protein [Sphingomonas adhaesiva]|uniref:dioxygenase family protein n=1 Tax=Sphingomonas adhaesiva TaxID=28212 RepID=UPI002FF67B9A
MTEHPTRSDQDLAYFDERRSAEVVAARNGAAADARTAEVLGTLVRHLHAGIREAAVTPEEWLAAIQFLTRTGQICTDWRQEFILLSDILGVSMLVDAINHHRPDGATENTVLGPFYVPDAPRYANGENICLDGKGEPMLVRGRVIDGEGRPVPGATLDVWATNDDGFYDVQQQDVQPANNLRGVFTAEADGGYWFRTVKPRFYPIPDDGPVGELLRALDRSVNRPAHLHFIVTAPGYDRVVTHIFMPDCDYLPTDAVFGVKSSLIAQTEHVDDAAEAKRVGLPNPFWRVDWDFVLVPTA